jgi:hypothetical protein
MAVAALGLLVAAAPAAQWLAETASRRSGAVGGARKLLAGAALAAAASAPVLVAVYWVADGVRGPIGNVATPLIQACVSASPSSPGTYRTILRHPACASYAYTPSGRHPTSGSLELTRRVAAAAALDRQVAALGTPQVRTP